MLICIDDAHSAGTPVMTKMATLLFPATLTCDCLLQHVQTLARKVSLGHDALLGRSVARSFCQTWRAMCVQ